MTFCQHTTVITNAFLIQSPLKDLIKVASQILEASISASTPRIIFSETLYKDNGINCRRVVLIK